VRGNFLDKGFFMVLGAGQLNSVGLQLASAFYPDGIFSFYEGVGFPPYF
jgi:hypothetical protein